MDALRASLETAGKNERATPAKPAKIAKKAAAKPKRKAG
jgi:hypothetical protein